MAILQVAPRQGSSYTSYSASLQRISLASLVATGGSILARGGVRPGGDLLVTAHSTPNMTVDVASGFALVQATSAVGGLIPIANNGSYSVTISAAHATYARYDLIVARFRDEEDSTATFGNANSSIEAVAGTPSASPVPPSVPSNSLVLAQITVGANVTTITSGNVADKRVYTCAIGGTVVCTSATRPTGTQLVLGLGIFETDTGSARFYDGTQWRGGIAQDIMVNGVGYVTNHGTINILCQYTVAAQPVPTTIRVRNAVLMDKTVVTDVFDVGIIRDGGAVLHSQGSGDAGHRWCVSTEYCFSLAAGVSTVVSSVLDGTPTGYTNSGTCTTYTDPRNNYMSITIDPNC